MAKMTGQLAVLAENAGAAMGREVNNEFVNKFTYALAGQTKGLKELGIFIDINTDAFKKQVAEIQKSSGYTEQQARAQAILTQLLEKGEKFTETASVNIKSISASLQTLKNTFDEVVGSKIGHILSITLSPIVELLTFIHKIPILGDFISWG